MFRFFTQKHWLLWSWIGSAIILSSLWIQVKIDVKINEWFGEFYDMIQKALGAPNSITIEEYWASLISFITLAAMYVGVAVIVSFFTSHYLFSCLLYTSDAADEEDSVDLGGRRIIKKKIII